MSFRNFRGGAMRNPAPRAVFSNRVGTGRQVKADPEGLRTGAEGLLELRSWLEAMFQDLDAVIARALQVVHDDSLDQLIAQVKVARDKSRLIETDLNLVAHNLDELADRAEQTRRI